MCCNTGRFVSIGASKHSLPVDIMPSWQERQLVLPDMVLYIPLGASQSWQLGEALLAANVPTPHCSHLIDPSVDE